MKQSLLFTACLLVCGAALAQAPAGVVKNPSAESSPTASGGMPAAKAEMKTDAKKAMDTSKPMASGGSTKAMGSGSMDMKAMDTNGDGMISKKEYMDYHTKMWGRMKSKNGKVSMADMEAMMKGGPN